MTEETILKKANSKKGLTEEIATRKRALNFYSLANILPDPDIVLRKQGKDIRIYKELLCDPHVFACIQSRKSGVLSLDWEINRGLDKDKNAEEIEELLKKLNIHKLISDILDATSYGYQPLEIIWKKSSSGHVLPAKIIAKPPEWFCFDDDNNLKFRTKDNYYGEIVPDKKFLLAQNNPSYNNPYGERTLSRVFWSVTFKKGSYAASNTHFAIRQDIVDADRKLVESVINQLIQWIYEINFSNQEVPVFEMYEPEDVDLTLAQRDKILSETGVKFTKEYFIKAYGLKEEDFDIREDVVPAMSSQFKEFKDQDENIFTPPGQEQIEDLCKFISDNKLSEQAQKMISPLIALIDDCEDFNEAYELLTDKNLHSKQFEQTLQKALFLCELQGRSDGLE